MRLCVCVSMIQMQAIGECGKALFGSSIDGKRLGKRLHGVQAHCGMRGLSSSLVVSRGSPPRKLSCWEHCCACVQMQQEGEWSCHTEHSRSRDQIGFRKERITQISSWTRNDRPLIMGRDVAMESQASKPSGQGIRARIGKDTYCGTTSRCKSFFREPMKVRPDPSSVTANLAERPFHHQVPELVASKSQFD